MREAPVHELLRRLLILLVPKSKSLRYFMEGVWDLVELSSRSSSYHAQKKLKDMIRRAFLTPWTSIILTGKRLRLQIAEKRNVHLELLSCVLRHQFIVYQLGTKLIIFSCKNSYT